jgi:hypothetical protein
LIGPFRYQESGARRSGFVDAIFQLVEPFVQPLDLAAKQFDFLPQHLHVVDGLWLCRGGRDNARDRWADGIAGNDEPAY